MLALDLLSAVLTPHLAALLGSDASDASDASVASGGEGDAFNVAALRVLRLLRLARLLRLFHLAEVWEPLAFFLRTAQTALANVASLGALMLLSVLFFALLGKHTGGCAPPSPFTCLAPGDLPSPPSSSRRPPRTSTPDSHGIARAHYFQEENIGQKKY